MKLSYLITYENGCTYLCKNLKELSSRANYSYSYIRKCIREKSFYFRKNKDIVSISIYEDNKLTKTLNRVVNL